MTENFLNEFTQEIKLQVMKKLFGNNQRRKYYETPVFRKQPIE